MKTKKQKILFTFAIVAVLMVTFRSLADDVYNFYFQKAAGPHTVIQGGGQNPDTVIKDDGSVVSAAAIPAATPTPAASSGQSVAAVPTPAPAAPKLKHWEVIAGAGVVADETGRYRGETLGVNYNFNKYVGVGASLIHAPEAVNSGNDGLGFSRDHSLDWGAGVTITPVHIELFGWDTIDIGLLAGFMSATHRSELTGADERRVITYLGPRFTLNFSENVATVWDLRLQNNVRYGQMSWGLMVKF